MNLALEREKTRVKTLEVELAKAQQKAKDGASMMMPGPDADPKSECIVKSFQKEARPMYRWSSTRM
eukprot:3880534-Pyramimonas_sp.AAC.1